ncbi:MAG: competence/damage-inducible protein A [Bacteroidota bacterium]
MKASILNIGNELLSGLVVNTNASFIAQCLDGIGVSVHRIDTVSDSGDDIIFVLNHHLQQSDLIIITGGLGPTNDDITKHTLTERFGMKLQFHQPSFDNIINMFKNRGLEISETNRQQAMLPDGCIALINTQGTAPGMWFEVDSKIVISLPGVPFEMNYLMEVEVIPRLKEKVQHLTILRKLYLTTGIPESYLQDRLRDWELTLSENTQLAYLPEPGIVKLRLSVSGNNLDRVSQQFDVYESQLRDILQDEIFGTNSDTLESVIGQLLVEKKKTLSVAESCTGGFLAHLITSVPGSSIYFNGGVVSYSNQVKAELLKVDPQLIEKFGAVSQEVVIAMSQNVRQFMKTDYAIAISGVAGPDGGSVDKPVGTVWIAIASTESVQAKVFNFGEHRIRNIRRAAIAALNELRLTLEKQDLYDSKN